LTGIFEIALQASRWAGLAFLAALFVIVLLKMSSGSLNIGAVNLGRGQLLVTTFGVASAYAYMAMTTVQTCHLPAPSPVMLGLLGASQGVYLSFKLAENWQALFSNS